MIHWTLPKSLVSHLEDVDHYDDDDDDVGVHDNDDVNDDDDDNVSIAPPHCT